MELIEMKKENFESDLQKAKCFGSSFFPNGWTQEIDNESTNLCASIDFSRKTQRQVNKELIRETGKFLDIERMSEVPEGRFDIWIEDVNFACFLKKSPGEFMYVFLQGFSNGTNNYFERWSWYSMVDGITLSIADPMIKKYPGIKVGWYLGTPEKDFRNLLSKIIEKIASIVGIRHENIILYGGSAGGTAAIHTASILNGSLAVAINPQIDLINDSRKEHFEKITGLTLSEYKINRIDSSVAIKNSSSKYIILQNCASSEDYMNNQLLTKKFHIKPKYGLSNKDNVIIWTYEAKGIRDPHDTFENRTMFTAIDALIKHVIIGNEVVEVDEIYKLFSEFWYDRYEDHSKSMINCVDTLLSIDNSECNKRAFELCSEAARYNEHFQYKLSEMYQFGIGTEKNYENALNWAYKSAINGFSGAWEKLLKILYEANSPNLSCKIMSHNDLESVLTEADEICLLARIYRDGRGVEKNLDEAIRLMRKAVELEGPVWAENELSAMLWERGLPEDDRDLKILSENLICKENVFGYVRLSRIYRDGRGVEKNLDEAIRLMRKAVELGIPNWGKEEFISLLAERHDSADCLEILNFEGEEIQDYVDYQLSRLYFNGLINKVNLKTIYKKSQRYCNKNHLIKPAFTVNNRLLKYENYCVCADILSMNIILSICLQHNIRPDFYICTDPKYNSPLAKAVDWKEIMDLESTAIITTEDDIPVKSGNENVFFTNHTNKDSSFLIHNSRCSDISNIAVIKDRDFIGSNKFIDYSEINNSGCLAIFRNGQFKSIELENFIQKYQVGAKIYESLESNVKWILPRWDNIGDVFKIASLIKEFKKTMHYSKVGIIVRDRLENISSLFESINYELSLSYEDYDALKSYVEYNMIYNNKIWYCSPEWSPFLSYTRTVSGTYFLQMPGEAYNHRREADRFKKWMSVPLSGSYERIQTVKIEGHRKILLNPFGGWIYFNFNHLRTKIWNLFNEISSKCVEAGISVYTNYNTESKVLSGSTMYEGSVCDLANEIGIFSDVVSVCTGLTDMVALTNCNMHIIYPDEGWLKEFSKRELCDRDNIFEYTFDDYADCYEIIAKDVLKKLMDN